MTTTIHVGDPQPENRPGIASKVEESTGPFLIGDAMSGGYGSGPDILHDTNFELHENEIVTIIGPNGAGKSTVLKSIFGLTDVRKGTVIHGSRDITGFPTSEIIRSGIAFVAQGNNTFADLTVATDASGRSVEPNTNERNTR